MFIKQGCCVQNINSNLEVSFKTAGGGTKNGTLPAGRRKNNLGSLQNNFNG
jgi:hypothetical protein